jgi:hypothetical protein
MWMHAALLSTGDEQNALGGLVVRLIGTMHEAQD